VDALRRPLSAEPSGRHVSAIHPTSVVDPVAIIVTAETVLANRPSNSAVERTAGSHSRAAAAHREG
jgi:hypothetical protein